MVAATVVMVRAARDYRPFPSVDDFAYLPLAWASHTPGLYPRDTLLQGFLHHTPAWDLIVAALDRTTGEPLGFWLLTILLTLGTVVATARLASATGVSFALFPLVVALAFCGPVIGFGRGAYDGALGDAFHVQWLSLCAVLWAYSEFVRGRPIVTGVWLGAAALFHPAVAAHAGFVLLVASLGTPGAGLANLVRTGAVALLVSLPVTIPVMLGLAGGVHQSEWPVREIVRLGYVFRTPHHYVLSTTPALTWCYLAAVVLAGITGALVPRPEPFQQRILALRALLAGQALLALCAVLLYGPWLPESWRYASTVPYVLDLSRTSGLLLPLAMVLVVGALERRGALRSTRWSSLEVLWIGLLAFAATALLFFVRWTPLLASTVALGLVPLFPVARRLRPGVLAAPWVLVAALGIVHLARATHLRAELTEPETELYHWVAGTAPDALFIIPPGMQGFRFYGRRSVYVDFKLFPPATPWTTPEWRRRVDLVSAPDSLALESAGWPGVPQWDRTYAVRNTPERIGRLLGATKADYFVWDRAGLDVPPYVPVDRPRAAGVAIAFSNTRFEVYRMSAEPDSAAAR